MRAISAETHELSRTRPLRREAHLLSSLRTWINEQEADWEDARITISGVGIFIQVTLAGIMIGVISALGAPPLAYSIGIFFAFMADSIAFGQAPMRWVVGFFVISSLVNILLTLYYAAIYLVH